MKTIRKLLLAAALVPGLAMAHAKLEMSVPAAGSSIAAMPAQLMLHFSEAVKMTAMSIEKEGGKDKIDLKVPAAAKSMVQVESPSLGAGAYLLNWRGLSDDGHIMSGTVRFTVTGK
ncbi:MAG: copper resistance CopC family protein [Pseudomonadota bacterium]